MAEDSLFIVVEGMDGSGKTGITRQLRAILSHTHGNNVALTFEPHDPSAAGLFVRDALTKRIKATPLTLALGFALNRADHNARIIDPFLSGKPQRIIISDRYTLSSLVYQSAGGLFMEDIYHINQWARRPDLTIYLNVSPQKCYERMRNRPQDKELFEKNLSQRAEKYQTGIGLLREKGETVVEVDANPDFPQVLNNVLDTLQTHAPDWLKIQPPLLVDTPNDDDTNLSLIADEDLDTVIKSLTNVDINNLSYSQINHLFKAYVLSQGFVWGEKLTWTEAQAYDIRYTLPMGFQQRGIALILDSTQQTDLITKTIQTVLDNSELQGLSDFMIVLDNGRFEPTLRYGRESHSGRPISPQVCLINREILSEWMNSD